MELSPALFLIWLFAPPVVTLVAGTTSSGLHWALFTTLVTIAGALVCTVLFLDSSGWGILLLIPIYVSTGVTLLTFGLLKWLRRSHN